MIWDELKSGMWIYHELLTSGARPGIKGHPVQIWTKIFNKYENSADTMIYIMRSDDDISIEWEETQKPQMDYYMTPKSGIVAMKPIKNVPFHKMVTCVFEAELDT
jgi:hypothetical protein